MRMRASFPSTQNIDFQRCTRNTTVCTLTKSCLPTNIYISGDDEDTSRKRDDDGDNCSDSDKLTTKSRRARMRFTPTQIQMLEQQFQEQHYLLPADRKILAMALRMTERQVKTWFQNKRAQYKRTRPLIRNPIYHNFRAGMGRQIAPFYSGAAISHLTFSDISNMCIHAYPTSPTFLPPVIVYHPPTSVAGSR